MISVVFLESQYLVHTDAQLMCIAQKEGENKREKTKPRRTADRNKGGQEGSKKARGHVSFYFRSNFEKQNEKELNRTNE